MSWHTLVLENLYEDSVRLLGLARSLREREGVEAAEVIVGSDGNRRELEERHGVAVEASPSDVIVAVEAEDEGAAEAALEAARSHFAEPPHASGAGPVVEPRSLISARGDANVALVSVPGEHAPLEAAKALEAGLHVFLFSDHVALEDEVALKRAAASRGLLLMGPGAGTSMVAGVGLGFANAVRRGPVGIVAAAGTGAQEVACLLDAAGVGVSHIIGVGGRDLSLEVGGRMMLAGARLLAEDPDTEAIVLVSKPPASEVVAELAKELPRGKPIIAGFVGHGGGDGEQSLSISATLEDAARRAAEEVGAEPPAIDREAHMSAARYAGTRLAAGQKAIRGLYSGGTLCFEALTLLPPLVGAVTSNVGGEPDGVHSVIDLGEEEYTADRPHPMVDLTLRLERLAAEAAAPEVACVLLDVVLGYGSHPDPASELAPAISSARETARREGRELVVVGHICGASGDPQDPEVQRSALEEAGAILAPTNALAVHLASEVVGETAS